MGAVLAFWLVAMLIALLALPIAATLLRRLPDAGAGLSFALGLVLAGYAYFILRTLSVLPQGRGGYIAVIALLALLSAAVAGRDRRLVSTFRRSWPGVVVAAGIFTCFFFAYVAFRSYNPDIAGTEQPMDLLYLNATINSAEYPPEDPWLAGEAASYYYFGYLQAGVLTAASGVPASTGYNLALAFTFAAAAAGAASLAYALARWTLGSRARNWALAAGGLAVLLLLFAGSISAAFEWSAAHGIYNRDLFTAAGVEWMIPCGQGVTENCYSGLEPRTDAWYPSEFWFWWRGSRIIPETITEFPFFSFLLGDLHPHVMSIPLVLLALGLSASLWRGRRPLTLWTHPRELFPGLALAVIFGALAFQNTWDVATFGAVLTIAVLARNFRGLSPGRAVAAAAGYLVPLAGVALFAYAPWWADFGSQAEGLYPYVDAGTRPAHALLQFGPLLGAGLLGIAWLGRARSWRNVADSALLTVWIPVLPLVIWVSLVAYHGDFAAGPAVPEGADRFPGALEARTAGGWVTLAIYGLGTWALTITAVALTRARNAAALPAALAATGALLLFGAELFIIRDVFFGSVPRLNTVFKLSYQAWMLLSVAGAVGLAALLRELRTPRFVGLAALPIVALIVLSLAYPVTAAANRTEGFSKETAIDGLFSVARNDPGEYALTRWIQENTAPGDVVLEATGRRWRRDEAGQPAIVDSNTDYSEAGRIASRTGRPTPIGWFFHEVQWRGETPENRAEFMRRQDLVDRAYTSKDPARVLEVMRVTGASYLVVGRVEAANYTPDLMPDFRAFLPLAFESASVQIYRMPEFRTVQTS